MKEVADLAIFAYTFINKKIIYIYEKWDILLFLGFSFFLWGEGGGGGIKKVQKKSLSTNNLTVTKRN